MFKTKEEQQNVNNSTSKSTIEDVDFEEIIDKVDPVEESKQMSMELNKGDLDKLFKNPCPGSLLKKFKDGSFKGKAAANTVESLLLNTILTAQAKDIPLKWYFLGHAVLSHKAACKFATSAFETVTTPEQEKETLIYLFDGKLSDFKEIGDYLKTIIPYHGDIIMNHGSLLRKMANMGK